MVAREVSTTERLFSKASVVVEVLDINDNWPVFAKDVYEAEVPENSPIGTSVVTITVFMLYICVLFILSSQ